MASAVLCNQGIKAICRKKIMESIFMPLKVKKEWKVLITDEIGMKLLSTLFKTDELLSCNIAAIESIEKTREPLIYLSAIYLLCARKKNIGFLKKDFLPSATMYQSAHIFFLSSVPDKMFDDLCEQTTVGFVKTFVELNILFLPCESQVYSLNDQYFFKSFFDSTNVDMDYIKDTAQKIVSVCSVLGVIPLIRYRRNFIKNFVLAEAVQQEFHTHELISSSNIQSSTKNRCQLLILDRGFDCISPIIHEFTFQAMAYDILSIKDDIYENPLLKICSLDESKKDEHSVAVSLTEDEPQWCSLRHEHIASVSKIIENIRQNVAGSDRKQLQKLPDLGNAVRKYLVEKKDYSFHLFKNMANECIRTFCSGLTVLTELEQNLALGKSADERSIGGTALKDVMSILSSKTYSIYDKLRLFLLYIFYKKGITKQVFHDIVCKTNLPLSDAYAIANVMHFDIDVFRPGSCKACDEIPDVTDSDPDISFKQSRWVPVIKKVMFRCTEGELSDEQYPFLGAGSAEPLLKGKRTGCWSAKNKNTSKLILFIVGGVTYSEMRCAYEVMKKCNGWEIFIGGDSLITPNQFIDRLGELRTLIKVA